MRTLEQALARAESLRDFRKTNEERFLRSADFIDIVNLADEVERLRSMGLVKDIYEHADVQQKHWNIVDGDIIHQEDHDESW